MIWVAHPVIGIELLISRGVEKVLPSLLETVTQFEMGDVTLWYTM
jgi:hypothetical protein